MLPWCPQKKKKKYLDKIFITINKPNIEILLPNIKKCL